LVAKYVPAGSVEEQWDIAALQKALESDWQLNVPLSEYLRDTKSVSEEDILEQVLQAAQAAYQQKVEAVGAESWSGFERSIMLQVIDTAWREHLSALDHLRQGIHLRGYAQKNPKQEYKREAFELFSGMLDRVRDDVVRVLMTVRIQTQEEIEQAEAEAARAVQMQNVQYQHTNYEEAKSEETQTQRRAVAQEHPGTLRNAAPKVGRNDPCPCGSGKKYKQCHGQLT
jgi:preprotein translocase subunit SecA